MSEVNSQNRLVSLDVFRGMTIAGMVLVNNPGSWSHIYSPLEHAEWNGLTPTDYIFPFFLFIVGVAIPIALGKRVETGVTRSVYTKIVTRAIVIYALGLAISVVPFIDFARTDVPDYGKLLIWLAFAAGIFFLLLRKFKVALVLTAVAAAAIVVLYFSGFAIVPYNFGMMRISGVLQRIAVCYLITSIVFLNTNWKQQLGIGVALLLGYWLVMTTIPVSGCDVTTFNDKACNLAAYIDRTIIGESHIWRQAKVYDPEGIMSTFPAIATTISGVLTGTWLKSKRSDLDKASGIFFFGVVLFAVGWIWNSYFPMNKSLWTSSYVLATSGLALLTLGFCYWLIDIKGFKKWTTPFVIFGVNALALFVFSGIFARIIGVYKIPSERGIVPIQTWVYENIFLAIAQPIDASLLFAITFILFWLFLMWLLYRKQICIKV
jgi:predicted acyltransferase